MIWKFFSNPIICLDGDKSGQSAALRIAEKLFPLISEENKIYFSIMTDGNDPDDYIKKNGKDNFLNLLKDKEIIQTFIWNNYLKKVNQKNPYEIAKFEKDIKKLCYSIKDETLKKYVLEDFLEKIRKLTPLQSVNKNFRKFNKFKDNKNLQMLKETTNLHKKKSHFTKTQIKEFSILFIMLNYPNITWLTRETMSEIKFTSETNESLKNFIISIITKEITKEELIFKSLSSNKELITDINENSSIQLITYAKKDDSILSLFNEILFELKDLKEQMKIESLEKKLINNLDENSFSELVKLKNQLNRE